MEPCVEIPLEEHVLKDVVEKAKDFCLMHGNLSKCFEGNKPSLFYLSFLFIQGICMRRKDAFDRDALHFAPFLLLPSPFPRQEFNRAVQLQTLLNELMHKVAHDDEFLSETLSKTIAVDDFTGKLYRLYKQVQAEGGSAQVSGAACL